MRSHLMDTKRRAYHWRRAIGLHNPRWNWYNEYYGLNVGRIYPANLSCESIL